MGRYCEPRSGHIVELEYGVWIAPWPGDPGRTLCRSSARWFGTTAQATRALEQAREYRPFGGARVMAVVGGEVAS